MTAFVDASTYSIYPNNFSQDSTAGFQAAIDAVSTVTVGGNPSGPRLFIPPGMYSISDMDLTDRSVDIEGCGLVWLYADRQTSQRFVLDLTGSDALRLKNIKVLGMKADGTPPTVKPTGGILMGHHTGTGGSSNANYLEGVETDGYFRRFGLYNSGSTNNKFNFCRFADQTTDGYALGFTTSNNFIADHSSFNSAYTNPMDTSVVTNENHFSHCEIHARFLDTTGTYPTIYCEGLRNSTFTGCNFTNGANQPIFQHYKQDSSHLTFLGGKCYSEAASGQVQHFARDDGFGCDNMHLYNFKPEQVSGAFINNMTNFPNYLGP